MIQLGCALSSEEQTPQELVKNAIRAEQAGFSFLAVSDHFHPWVEAQGQSAFIWTVLGAIAQATKRIKVITGVTAPIIRIHPVILAQATATTAALFGDRFLFGVGTGENLNEHVVGLGWPSYHVRAEMLREAIEILRELWQGKMTNYEGKYYTVDTARIYSLPKQPPSIIISGFGPKSAQLAGEIGDGFYNTAPEAQLVQAFNQAGGKGKPVYGQTKIALYNTEAEGQQIAYTYWPHSAASGQTDQELRVPQHFEQLGKSFTPETVGKNYICVADPQKHIEQIDSFAKAGFTHVSIGQIGPDQERFFRFYEENIIPHYRIADGETLPRSARINGKLTEKVLLPPVKRGRGRPKKLKVES
jgi:G6PDH family F420-dependent oxidoreductase